MRLSSLIVCLLLLCTVGFLGCQKAPEKTEPQPKTDAGQAPDAGKAPLEVPVQPQNPIGETKAEPKPETKLEPGAMVADVNGTIITYGELAKEVNNLMLQMGGRVDPQQQESMRGMVQKQALEYLVNQMLVGQEADKKGIVVTPEEIDAKFATVSQNFPSKEQFDAQMARMGITEVDLRNELGLNLKMEKLLDPVTSALPPLTDEEIKKFYDENGAQLKIPERVRASHILITTGKQDDDATKQQKRQKIADIRQQILNGKDFAEAAKEFSECPSKERGGDLNYFERGRMVKPFEDAAFQMKPGEMSDIVETDFGYHIIKVAEHQVETMPSLDEVKSKITDQLTGQRREKALSDFIAQLRTNAKLNYAEGFQPTQETQQP